MGVEVAVIAALSIASTAVTSALAGNEASRAADHAKDVAAQQAQHEADVAAALQAQAKIDAANAITDAATAGEQAISNTQAQNAINQEMAQGAWNRQESQVGTMKQSLQVQLGGMAAQEKSTESSMRASTAASGLAFSGSALVKTLVQQQSYAVAEKYTETQGNAAIQGAQADADLQLKVEGEREAQNVIQAQQYSDRAKKSAEEYSQDVLAKAALGVSEAAWSGQQQIAAAQWAGDQAQSNVWLSAFTSVLNTATSLTSKFWSPSTASSGFTSSQYLQNQVTEDWNIGDWGN
jgi:hypothetical protein